MEVIWHIREVKVCTGGTKNRALLDICLGIVIELVILVSLHVTVNFDEFVP